MLGIPKRIVVVAAVVLGLAIIYSAGSEQRESEADAGDGPDGAAAACRVVVTADVLNVRAGPGTEHEVVDRLRADVETDATDEVRDGFRRITGQRWAADEFLRPVEGADCG
ncbi:SH3 domain-containing protein [Saccharomonospora iraqiensis]|uniref:SH3 domain-containing protein n=1 Tax=Saccharomonospora iraqiensis TaxID=52698 RepID=UPI0003F922CF|nr:SH3 domain-containing protein [Saccharomonospora iraqiensis]